MTNEPRSGSAAASTRVATVMAHVEVENAHDLDAVMATYGPTGFYDDAPWNEHHAGLEAVRRYYASLFRASADLHIDVSNVLDAGTAVVLELTLTGTHTGSWRGLPPTGRTFAIPICAVFTFDGDERLSGERIYYDRATVLRQLGVFSEPDSLPSKLMTPIIHPVTIARAAKYAIGTRWRARRSGSSQH